MLILLLVHRNEGTFTQCVDKGYVSFALCPLPGYLGRRETSKDNEEGQEEAETPLEQEGEAANWRERRNGKEEEAAERLEFPFEWTGEAVVPFSLFLLGARPFPSACFV